MSALSMVKRWFRIREDQPVDRYHLRVVTNAGELTRFSNLPLEIQFVLAKHPERLETFRELLERGYGIGVRTVEKTPEQLLTAIDRISHQTQENTILPWLPRLLREGELPIFTEYELRIAEKEGINLYQQAKLILEKRYEFKKIVFVDLENRGLGERERGLAFELNKELYPLAVDYVVSRVLFDHANARTEVAQTILKALLIIGPVAHGLEHWISGVGKLFAASADDMLAETAELFALRGSGFTWQQLIKRSRILIPVFALATYGAFQVEPLIAAGKPGWAGVVFGLSAVALSLTTALQSIGLYAGCYKRLRRMAKLPSAVHLTDTQLALRQDFTNPARLGLFVGAFSAPIVAAIVFIGFTHLVENGWVLAILGSVESLVAGFTVIGAKRLNKMMFQRRVKQEIVRLNRSMRV